MKFGEFWLELIIFVLLFLILYIAQPSFSGKRAGIIHFFVPEYSTSTTGTKLSPSRR
jgi:hypothetical protein